jgi:hypothetical protein
MILALCLLPMISMGQYNKYFSAMDMRRTSKVAVSEGIIIPDFFTYLKLNGNLLDYNGINNGTPGIPSTCTFTNGLQYGTNIIQCAVFNGGLSQYFSLSNSISLTTLSTGMTWSISLWFYPTLPGGPYRLIGANDNTSTGYTGILLYLNGGTLSFYGSYNGASWSVNNVFIGTPAINTWNNVVITRSSSNMQFMLDGVYSGGITSLGTNTFYTNSVGWNIGRWGGESQYFQGYMQSIRLYNRALSMSEGTNIWQSGGQ